MESRVKYPRTMHLPFSQGISNDDKVLNSVGELLSDDVVLTVKMDGECTTQYCDGIHARSKTYSYHPSRTWIKKKHAEIAHLIPPGYRVCGENVFARHSIGYEDLLSYFYIFSVWNFDTALSWSDTEDFARELGFPVVPVLYKGRITESELIKYCSSLDTSRNEGLVVRPLGEFNISDFSTRVGKFVRKGHVQTDKHWMHNTVIPNKLA